ncbi:putative acid phosphatase homologues [Lyophyllum shimeji]|uniref:Acid phosphatase homologues n=1 Tax=Lyophyllum shimeji TaxID=47721 RepID=A0A9P3USZ2_LYOSH|nr:putative acid phosphatase homologues [Lyophyllum shimeji]
MPAGPQASLDLTHVLYDDSSLFSLALALITLSPILLMASYAALAVQTREYVIIVMWAGQLAGEVLNWLLKHAIKEERPIESIGNGYGFPSSHSQFASTGYPILDQLWRMIVHLGLAAWAAIVAYSRYYLGYHNANQILWGIAIGLTLGLSLYTLAELIPRRSPRSILGNTKRTLISNPVSTWLQIRDGWDVWADGGREVLANLRSEVWYTTDAPVSRASWNRKPC